MSLVIFWNKIEVSLNSLDSKNVFVLVLAHLEPELELFEVWEMMVPQILITIFADVINFKQL